MLCIIKCSCDIKININPNYDYKFNKNEFFKSFTDIKNIANINIIKCYKVVLKLKNLISNYGFIIIGSIMLLFIITIFIFIFKSHKKIKKYLYKMSILSDKIKPRKIQPIIKENKNSKKIKFKKHKKRKNKNLKYKDNDNDENNINIYNINNDNKSSQINNNKIKKMNDKTKDFEINSLEYQEAFKLDKRNYFQYYISLLKFNHPLLFAFWLL